MRIPPISTPPVRRAAATTPRTPFDAAVPGSRAQPAASPSAASPAASVATLVALAAIDDQRERRRRAVEHAEAGLDALEALDAELGEGAPSDDRLRALAEWSATLALPDDAELAAIVRDIDLRAQIERAKHDRTRAIRD